MRAGVRCLGGVYGSFARWALHRVDMTEPENTGPVDVDTSADYLAANLHASGGASVVDPTAVVEGTVERCVVWDGAHVAPDEHLVDAVRAGTPADPVTARPA